jgi:hypothetical protein
LFFGGAARFIFGCLAPTRYQMAPQIYRGASRAAEKQKGALKNA